MNLQLTEDALHDDKLCHARDLIIVYSLAGKGTGEGGKDGEGSEGTKASEEPSSRSAGFQFHFFWPLLLLSLITLK